MMIKDSKNNKISLLLLMLGFFVGCGRTLEKLNPPQPGGIDFDPNPPGGDVGDDGEGDDGEGEDWCSEPGSSSSFCDGGYGSGSGSGSGSWSWGFGWGYGSGSGSGFGSGSGSGFGSGSGSGFGSGSGSGFGSGSGSGFGSGSGSATGVLNVAFDFSQYLHHALAIAEWATSDGKVNGSLDLADGESPNWLSAGDIDALIDDQFTISAWAKVAQDSEGYIAGKAASSYNDMAIYYHDGTDTFSYMAKINGTEFYMTSGEGSVNLDQWYHVALTYNGADLIAYLDGVEVARESVSGYVDRSGNHFVIGNRSSFDRAFIGNIDEVVVWNVGLTESDVSLLYQNGDGLSLRAGSDSFELSSVLSITSGVIGYWPLDEDTIGSEEDLNDEDGFGAREYEPVMDSMNPCHDYASGGELFVDGNYCIRVFRSSGELNALRDFNAEILLVGAGGGGSNHGGGGGAGGVIYRASYAMETGLKNVSIGLGGAGGIYAGANLAIGMRGQDSVFESLVAFGGGTGASSWSSDFGSIHGGSGGGGIPYSDPDSGPGTGTLGQGFSGGAGSNDGACSSESLSAGGGGGAGGPGHSPQLDSTCVRGAGGVGLRFSQFAVTGQGFPAGWFAGGGGGGGRKFANGGAARHGGGAGGDGIGGHGSNGRANTGGGGGGGGEMGTGGMGGSGVFMIRYRRN